MNKWTRANYLPGIGLGDGDSRVTASPEHITLAKNAAKEGMVLLKNQGRVLPLPAGAKVALFGKATFDYVKGGGGSGDVTVSYIRNLYDGLKAQKGKVTVYEDLADFYRENVRAQYASGREPGMTVEPEVPEELLKKARAYTDTAIISISRFSGEGWDRKIAAPDNGSGADTIFEDGDFYLTHAERATVEQVKRYFPKVIAVLNVGGMVDTCWFHDDDQIQGVLMAWQGGMEGGTAAAELLVGDGCPSGKLSDTFARELSDYPSSDNFHESRNYVEYTDDIYVGYRYFETIPGARERVNYPFGFGLSYTEFMVKIGEAVIDGDAVHCSVSVTNTGSCAGKEVVQAYFSAPQGKLGKPVKVLCAFTKTRLLQPGDSQLLTLHWDIQEMASYDDTGAVCKSAYVLEQGEYHFFIGTSVEDVRELPLSYTVEADAVVRQLSCRMAPTALSKRIRADGTYQALEVRESEPVDDTVLEALSTEGIHPARTPRSRWTWDQLRQRKLLLDVAEGTATMDAFLAQLTDTELAGLLGGQTNTGVADTFGFGDLPDYGVPNIMTADGPAGLRIIRDRGICTTAWPCSTMLACTWNPEIVWQVGAAGGAEVKENNIAVWLTPAVNIHRSPLCGRNFEYYSEDPFLTGKLASAMVQGIQSNHIAATVKHFALNNKETNRKNCDSRASERAIREIYIKAFEIIVREAKPWVIMSSYNLINGVRASESADLLTEILRNEWGYDGVVISDWSTFGEHYKEAAAGNDIKMPAGFPDRLMEALERGDITRLTLETCAKRVLELILKID